MKIKTLSLSLGYLLLGSLLFVSCLEDRVDLTKVSYTHEEYAILSQHLNLPLERASFQVEFPAHMTRTGAVAPEIDDAKATLGSVLFYDKKLSANNKVSCESCHKQSLAFSDDVAFSEGFDGQLTKRNSLPLASTPNFESSYNGSGNSFFTGMQAGFFWDERAHSIAEQSKMTLEDDIEMGVDIYQLAGKLSDIPYYQILFQKAYGSPSATPDKITDALEVFINSFVSVSSPFDEGLNQHQTPFADFTNFSQQENLGKTLFNTHCNGCHSSDFTALVETVANNGLDIEYEDKGMGERTQLDFDNGRFKVPFLRNVALTGPYMHDGRFETLEEVIDHYSEGIQDHPNLDFRLRDGFNNAAQPRRFNFTETEKAALIAFLHTVTDDKFIQDERFADPFK